jgi:hypothetical protein
LSKFPSPDEFEASLDAIRNRDKGTPELEAEARCIEPTEASLRAFLTKKADLIQAKREAVRASPVLIWLASQHSYQKATKRIFKRQPPLQPRPKWLESQIQYYLGCFTDDDLNISDDPELMLLWQDSDPESRRIKRFQEFVVDRLYSYKTSWESMFISRLYRYVQKTAQLHHEPHTRSNREHDEELAAIEQLLNACAESESRFFSFDASAHVPVLERFREQLLFEKSLSEQQPLYIKASTESVFERELILEIWQWLESNRIHVSGRSLHELLSIDGLERALPDVRSVQRMLSEWRRSGLG